MIRVWIIHGKVNTCTYQCYSVTLFSAAIICMWLGGSVVVKRLPSTQNVACSNPAWGSSFFSLEQRGVVFGRSCLLCLVSLDEFTCTVHIHCVYLLLYVSYIYMYTCVIYTHVLVSCVLTFLCSSNSLVSSSSSDRNALMSVPGANCRRKERGDTWCWVCTMLHVHVCVCTQATTIPQHQHM